MEGEKPEFYLSRIAPLLQTDETSVLILQRGGGGGCGVWGNKHTLLSSFISFHRQLFKKAVSSLCQPERKRSMKEEKIKTMKFGSIFGALRRSMSLVCAVLQKL